MKETKWLFHYNAACAYSRAVEQVDKQTDLADRDVLREKYRKQAITDLTESFKQGFDDYDYPVKDPDFKILLDDVDFKKILAGQVTEQARRRAKSWARANRLTSRTQNTTGEKK